MKIEIKSYIDSYIKKSTKKRLGLKKATSVGSDEVVSRIEDFSADPSVKNLIILTRGLTTSGVFISRSFLRYLTSHIDFSKTEPDQLSEADLSILKSVSKKIPIDPFQASPKEIFSAIFRERVLNHDEPNKHATIELSPEPFKTTLVLVSGVLNEIFSNAAFERGAQHLSKNLGIHYICPKVDGTKSVEFNSNLLKDQLIDYTEDNPEEKLWLLGFSKGGVDCLHFLADNLEFSNNKIIGLSTIASPILGANHLNHKLLKVINSLHNYSDNQFYKFFEKQTDLLFKEFQESLSQEQQTAWFSENHHLLPNLNFYTSLAMESNWKESHFWMILTKAFFQNDKLNDGVVVAENALFPSYFDSHNFGIMKGHHLIGTRSSTYNQEALLEAHVIYLQYLNQLN
jgi:hypothetical protein